MCIPMGGGWLAGRSPGPCALSRIEGIRGTLWGAKPFHHFLPVGLWRFWSIEGLVCRSRMTPGFDNASNLSCTDLGKWCLYLFGPVVGSPPVSLLRLLGGVGSSGRLDWSRQLVSRLRVRRCRAPLGAPGP